MPIPHRSPLSIPFQKERAQTGLRMRSTLSERLNVFLHDDRIDSISYYSK